MNDVGTLAISPATNPVNNDLSNPVVDQRRPVPLGLTTGERGFNRLARVLNWNMRFCFSTGRIISREFERDLTRYRNA